MTKMLQSSKQISAWQIERERILTRVVRSFEFRIGRGEKRCRASRLVARRYHGVPFKADPSKKLALRPVTLRRLHKAWKHAGEVAVAFRLNYTPHRPTVRAPLFVRFTKFISQNRFASMQRAWAAFQRQDARAGSRGNNAAAVSYGKAVYWFPAAAFYQIQAQLAAIENAQKELNRLQLITVSGIREKLPDRLPGRKRVKRGPDFQI